MQTAKTLLDLDDLDMGILNSAIGMSPAVTLMGRQLATRLPVVNEQLSPRQHRDGDIRKLRTTWQNDVQVMLRSATWCTQITALQPVLLTLDGEKQWSTPSTVFRSDSQNRSYVVKTNAGICYRKNRKHLQGVPNMLPSVPTTSLMIRTFRLRIQATSCRRTIQVMKSCRRMIQVMQSCRPTYIPFFSTRGEEINCLSSYSVRPFYFPRWPHERAIRPVLGES